MFRKVFLLFVLGSAISLSADFVLPKDLFGKYPHLSKFVEKYACSEEVTKNKSSHHLKGGDISRIINAVRMRQCIKRNGLKHLRVADKCLLCENDSIEVLSQKVNFREYNQEDAALSKEEVQELVCLAEETGFRDWAQNFDWDTEGKITFYDTEDNSFVIGMYRGVEGRDLPNHCKFNFAVSLMMYYSYMTPEAKEWYEKRLNDLLNSDEGTCQATMISKKTEYDDDAMNFEEVKKEYGQFLKELREKNWD